MHFYLNDTVSYKNSPDWIINAISSDIDSDEITIGLYNLETGESAKVLRTSNEITLVKRGDPMIEYLDDIDDESDPTYTALFRFHQRVKKHYGYKG